MKEDQLLLSITAPLAKDDLMPENTIKRPEGQQQRLLSVFTVPEVKPSWDTTMIKEGILYSKAHQNSLSPVIMKY